MRFGRVVIAAVVLTVLHFFYSWLTCGWLFNWVYALEPVNVWIDQSLMTTNFFIWVSLGQLIINFFFVLILAVLYNCIPGKMSACKGATYGFFVWLLGVLPGMFATYMFMTVNDIVVLYWAISGLLWLIVAGIIASLIVCGKGEGSAESCCCR